MCTLCWTYEAVQGNAHRRRTDTMTQRMARGSIAMDIEKQTALD
jgi:hypothetical protein